MATAVRKKKTHTYLVWFLHYKKGGHIISSTSQRVAATSKDEAKSITQKRYGRIWGVTVTRLY